MWPIWQLIWGGAFDLNVVGSSRPVCPRDWQTREKVGKFKGVRYGSQASVSVVSPAYAQPPRLVGYVCLASQSAQILSVATFPRAVAHA